MGGPRRWFGSAALLPELRGSDERIFWVAAALRIVVSVTLGTVVLLFADDLSDPVIIGIASVSSSRHRSRCSSGAGVASSRRCSRCAT